MNILLALALALGIAAIGFNTAATVYYMQLGKSIEDAKKSRAEVIAAMEDLRDYLNSLAGESDDKGNERDGGSKPVGN